jgi:alpha-1,3-rhamnosyltransferase
MISILVPLYNGIEFLEECIFTVANQTYKEFECIVGINGHDQFSDIEMTAREICYKYNRELINEDNFYDKIFVKWYSTKGKENTLNEMVKDCRYNYIAVLDCDDKWELTKLAKQVPYLGLYDVIGFYYLYREQSFITNIENKVLLLIQYSLIYSEYCVK